MSYNREWDQGKPQGDWNSQGGEWNYNNYSRNTRGREDEEYYGGEKRRRHNDYQGAPSQYENYSQDSWNTGQDYNDNSYDDRRGGGGRKKHAVSEPTQHVIFLGLDPDFTEGDLQAYLQGNNCVLDNVTIIRERGTGLSKGFGFAQFASIEHARAFVDPNFPFINMPPPTSHDASAAAAFKQAMPGGGNHSGRRVKIDYSQSAHNSDRRGPKPPSNDGTRDIGTSPSTLVLLRGLDTITTPATIALTLRTAAGPGKDGANGLRRVLLVKDKVTGLGWGFAFLDFVDQKTASALLGALMSPQLHPAGFRINDKPVAASFAHPFSFQPLADNAITDDACVPSSNTLGGGEGFYVRYWDEASTVAEMSFDVEEPEPQIAVTDKKLKKKRAPDDQVSAFLGSVSEEIHAVEAAASALPLSDKPVTLSLNKSGISANKLGVPAPLRQPIMKMALGGQEDAEELPDADGQYAAQSSEQDKAAAAKKVAPLIASKKVASSITKWNSVQEELSGKAAPAVVEAKATSMQAKPAPAAKKEDKPIILHGDFDYADSKKMACYLCSRQFKSLDQLRRHNQESDLHKKNIKDDSLRQIAKEKAAASQEPAGETPKYRDRAQERRALHNQPDTPLPEDAGGKVKRKADAPPPPPPPPPPPLAPAKDETNVGNKLLQKMGWSQGMGLGTEGEGRVDPIETAIYAQGAGLGASKGKEIGKYADGYSGYVHMARDSARERFDEPRTQS